jgi:hypothetical protein
MIGSSQLFTAIHLVYEQSGYTSSSVGGIKDYLEGEGEIPLTSTQGIQYKCPSDLLKDAMKWFQRAWDLWGAVHNYVYASQAANRLGACHLEALYTPCVFFQKTKQFAGELGGVGHTLGGLNSWGVEEEGEDLHGASFMKGASIEEIYRTSEYTLQVCSEGGVPLQLIEAYLNMAELKLISGMI